MKRFIYPVFAAATVLAWSTNAAEFDCLIEARQQVDIRNSSAQVQCGDLVKKGQVIATLESGPEHTGLELARSRLELPNRSHQIPAGARYPLRFD
jgi:hypothetical protein